jgi:hypothetical protein
MLNIAPKLLLRSLLVLIALACLSYLADFAVPRKDGKEEYMEDDPRVESCVHSLYPHSAVPPCWYLNKHREQRVNM